MELLGQHSEIEWATDPQIFDNDTRRRLAEIFLAQVDGIGRMTRMFPKTAYNLYINEQILAWLISENIYYFERIENQINSLDRQHIACRRKYCFVLDTPGKATSRDRREAVTTLSDIKQKTIREADRYNRCTQKATKLMAQWIINKSQWAAFFGASTYDIAAITGQVYTRNAVEKWRSQHGTCDLRDDPNIVRNALFDLISAKELMRRAQLAQTTSKQIRLEAKKESWHIERDISKIAAWL